MFQALGAAPAGGMTPPGNAVAQFPVEIMFDTHPTTLTIDFSAVIQKMTASRTYGWSLVLWPDSVIDPTGYKYALVTTLLAGRISTDLCDANIGTEFYTTASSMTSGVQANTHSVISSKAFSSGKETITLKDVNTYARAGKWRGIFTLIPPWTDEYTGEKVTTCPSGFLTYT